MDETSISRTKTKSPSIPELAKISGLSTATISRALSGSPLVKEPTRKKVEQLARQHGYRTNNLARMLKTGRSQLLGYLSSDLSKSATVQCYHELEDTLNGATYHVLIADSRRSPEKEIDSILRLREHQVEGIMIAPTAIWTGDRNPEIFHQLVTEKFPIILLANLPDIPCDQVFLDDFSAGRRLVREMARRGRRHIGVIAFDLNHNIPSVDRLAGIREELNKHSEMSLQVCDALDDDYCETVLSWFRKRQKPDVLIGFNERFVYPLHLPLSKLKISMPEELELVAFGTGIGNEWFDPPISSITHDQGELVTQCAQILLERINKPKSSVRRIGFDYEFKLRD